MEQQKKGTVYYKRFDILAWQKLRVAKSMACLQFAKKGTACFLPLLNNPIVLVMYKNIINDGYLTFKEKGTYFYEKTWDFKFGAHVSFKTHYIIYNKENK